MRKNLKRAVSLFLVMLMLFTSVPVQSFVGIDFSALSFNAAAEDADETTAPDEITESDEATESVEIEQEDLGELIDSGSAGVNHTWEMYDSGTLVIKGEGDMPDLPMPTGPYPLNVAAYSVSDEEYAELVVEDEAQAGEYFSAPKIFGEDITENLTAEDALPSVDIFEQAKPKEKDKSKKDDASVTEIQGETISAQVKEYESSADAVSDPYVDEDGMLSSNPWAQYYNTVTKVIIDDGVTNIGSNAFVCFYYLREVVLADSVKEIGSAAFGYCWSLTDINLESVEAIGENSFFYCVELEEANLESVVLVGREAFYYCVDLETLVFGEALRQIESYAFCYCIQLQSIEIPESLEYYGEGVFAYSGFIAETIINNSSEFSFIESVEELIAFPTLDGAKKFTFIQAEVFKVEVKSEISDVYPENEEELIDNIRILFNEKFGTDYSYDEFLEWVEENLEGSSAYEGLAPYTRFFVKEDSLDHDYCKEFALTHYIIGSEYVHECFEYAGTSGNVDWSIDTENRILTLSGRGAMENYGNGSPWARLSRLYDTVVFAPGSAITRIGSYAFYNCEIREIRIPATVKRINENAFSSCNNLVSVVFEEGLTTDGDIAMPSLERIEDSAFQYCNSLEGILLPASLEYIDYSAFNSCDSLKSVIIPANVSYIGEYAFAYCSALESVEFEEGSALTEFKYGVFYECDSLKSFEIPENIEYFNRNVLYGCDSLEEVNVAQGNECYASVEGVIYDSGLYRLVFCPAGKKGYINIPSTVSDIDAEILADIRAVEGFTVEEGNEYFAAADGVLYDVEFSSIIRFPSSYEGEYTVPDAVMTICASAFRNCDKITEISFTEVTSLMAIDEYAFAYCDSLRAIEIPSSVSSIGGYAFYDCQNLSSVVFGENSELNHLGFNLFYNCDSLEEIVIPAGVSYIDEYAFQNCSNLRKVTFEEGSQLLNIYYGAFLSTAIEEITLPESVSYIDRPFSYCRSLETVTILNPDCTIDSLGYDIDPVIKGYSASTAQDYAQNNGLEFVSLDDRKVESITVSCLPYKTSYRQGSTFNSDGLEITIVFDDGSTYVKSSGFTVTGFDSSEVGTCTLTVSYGDVSTTFDVQITEFRYPEIRLGQTLTVEIEPYNITYIKFVPTVSGQYVFTSEANADTFGYLYDSYKNRLTSDDDGGYNNNFYISYYLTAGETYYWGARYYDEGRSGSFNVKLTAESLDCEHSEITEYPQIDATCTSDGVTAAKVCNNCGYYLEGGTVIPAYHKDDNNDRICDVCEASTLIASGSAGNNITWTLYSGGDLIFSGSGELWSNSGDERGYHDFADIIRNIYVEDGITFIPYGPMSYLYRLETIIIYNPFCSINTSYDTIPENTVIKSYVPSDAQNYANNYSRTFESLGIREFTEADEGDFSYTENIDGTVTVTGYNGTLTYFAIPDEINGRPVTAIADNAFYDNDSLNGILIPETVLSVGEYAFAYSNYLSVVSIPASLTYLGGYAFNDCSNLVSVTFAEGSELTTIEECTFMCCGSLTSIEIPETVRELSTNAFTDCYRLSEISFGGNSALERIGDVAFTNCYDLAAIEIPDSVTYIGNTAFSNCDKLTSVEIPAAVTEIGSWVFQDCNLLSSVTFESGSALERINESAFRYCNALTSIDVPAGVEYIGYGAFWGTNLQTITINNPDCSIYDSYSTINENAVIYGYGNSTAQDYAEEYNREFVSIGDEEINTAPESDFDYDVNSDGTVTITGYYGTYRSFVIPDTIGGRTVSAIGASAFYNNTTIRTVYIPDTVTEIDSRAFQNCSKLRKVVFGDESQLTSIGSNAFYNCSALKEINFSENGMLSDIESYAFYNCYNLSEVDIYNPDCTIYYDYSTFSENIKIRGYKYSTAHAYAVSQNRPFEEIGDGEIVLADESLFTYEENSDDTVTITGYTGNLSAFEIPATINGKTVTAIGNEAFYCKSNIMAVIIPAAVTSIGSSAFNGCTSLIELTFAENSSLTSIGSYAFCNNYHLQAFDIPDDVTYIGEYAFYYCYSIESIVIPDGVTEIGEYTFYNCRDMSELVIPAGVTEIGSRAFCNCEALVSVTIPAAVTEIKDFTFYDCYNLRNVQFAEDNTLEAIGEYAFAYCNELTDFDIPDSVTEIGRDAFHNCSSLTSVIIPAGVTSINEYTFAYCYNLSDVQFAEGSALETIGYEAFYDCDSLGAISVPDSLRLIGDYAFYSCNSLTAFPLTENSELESIGSRAFGYCGLEEFFIPGSLETLVDYNVFANGTVTNGFTLSEENDNFVLVDGVLYSEDMSYLIKAPLSVESIVISEDTTKICDSAFYNCDSLTSVIIEDSTENNDGRITAGDADNALVIGEYAFSNCGALESIVLPTRVSNVYSYAFNYCELLKDITILNTECYIDHNGWYGYNENPTVHGFCNSAAGYLAEDRGFNFDATHVNSDEWIITKDVLCNEDGERQRQCTRCRTVFESEAIPNPGLDHVMTDWIIDVEPGCLTDGSKHRDCENCSYTETEILSALGHNPAEEWTMIDEATCTEDGLRVKYCTRCEWDLSTGEVLCDKSTYPETPHEYGNSQTYEYEFSYEGAEKLILTFSQNTETENNWDYVRIYDSQGNQIGDRYCGDQLRGAVIEVPGDYFRITLSTDGSVTRYGFSFDSIVAFATVDETFREVIPALGHDLSGDFVIDTEATCTTDGSKSKHCSRCDYVGDVTVIPAFGHDYPDEWTIETEENCLADGLEYKECSICRERLTQVRPALGHEPSEEWTVTKEATCTEDGFMAKFCTRCNWNLGAEHLCDRETYPESDHSLGHNKTYNYSFSYPGAEKLVLVFDSNTHTENNYDYIYIYGPDGNQIGGRYCGDQLRNKTIEVLGDSFTIKITTDGSVTSYGFRFEAIKAYAPVENLYGQVIPASHIFGEEWTEGFGATCTQSGYNVKLCEVCSLPAGEWSTVDDTTVFNEYTYSPDGETEITKTYYSFEGENAYKSILNLSAGDDNEVNVFNALGALVYSKARGTVISDEDIEIMGGAFVVENIFFNADEESEDSFVIGSTDVYTLDTSYIQITDAPLGHSFANVPTVFPQNCTDAENLYRAECVRCCVASPDAIENHSYELVFNVENGAELDNSEIRVIYFDDNGELSYQNFSANADWFAREDTVSYSFVLEGVMVGYIHKCSKSALADLEYELTINALSEDNNSAKELWKGNFASGIGKYDITFSTIDEHLWDDGVITDEPTCSTVGTKLFTCSVCDEEKTEAIDTVNHNYVPTVIEPDCTNKGYTLYECSFDGCDAHYTAEETDALGHNYVCEEIGATDSFEAHKLYTCSRCGDSYTVLYPAVTVENLVALPEAFRITLSWSKAVEASVTGYEIYRKTGSEADFSLLATVNSRERLSYVDDNLVSGQEYTYKICALKGDVKGEMSAPVTSIAKSDLESPRIMSVSPSSYTVLYKKYNFTVTADDNIGVAKIRMYISAESEGTERTLVTEVSAPTFRYSFDTTAYADGTYYVWFEAIDTSGNVNETGIPYVYRIDNTGPDKVNNVNLVAVTATTATLSWDDVKAQDRKSFRIERKKADGTYTTVVSSTDKIGYNFSGLSAETEYTYRVAAVDLYGNIGTYSDDFTFTTATDTTAPKITSTYPAAGYYNNSFTYSVNANDPGGIAKITIEAAAETGDWSVIGEKEFTSNTSVSFSCTVNTDSFSEGKIYVRAVVTDRFGNEAKSSTEYIVDRTAPAVPQGFTAQGKNGYISLSWTQGSESDLRAYTVYRSDSADGEFVKIVNSRNIIAYNDSNVEFGGEYFYKICAIDTAGNISECTDVISARCSEDTENPTVYSVYPSTGDFVGVQKKQISVSYHDNNLVDRVYIGYKTGLLSSYSTLADFTNVGRSSGVVNAQIPLDEFDNGDTVKICVKVYDISGNESETKEYTYTVDKTAPTVRNLGYETVDGKLRLTWNCSDSDTAGFYIYLSTDGGKTMSSFGSRSVNRTGEYTFEFSLSAVSANAFSLYVVAVDNVGNRSDADIENVAHVEIEKEIVKVAPTAVINCPAAMEVGVEEIFDASDSFDGDGQIVSYHWDFGDGTESSSLTPIKKYTQAGEYTVSLTVRDNDGQEATATRTVNIKDRENIGYIRIKAVDYLGNPLAGVPVYLDPGTENQVKVAADENGIATFVGDIGEHVAVVFYFDGEGGKKDYLPVQKSVVILADSTSTITIKVAEGAVIEGSFEIKRMTLDEIQAAGIDISNPDNHHIIKTVTTVFYAEQSVRVDTYYNPTTGGFFIGNSGPSGGGGGGGRSFNGGGGGHSTRYPDEVNYVAIFDFPTEASFLKEMFDVRLHLICNATTDFSLVSNSVELKLPDGMSFAGLSQGREGNGRIVEIEEIPGGTSYTIQWFLRGDKEGLYDLEAEYNGLLAIEGKPFETVKATFRTQEPIKVYGVSAANLVFDFDKTLRYGAVYFNVGLENVSDIDIFYPEVKVTSDTITNYVYRLNQDGIYETKTVRLRELGVVLETESGYKHYLPGMPDTLSPGEKVYRQYVAYGIADPLRVGYFEKAITTELTQTGINIVTNSIDIEHYGMDNIIANFENLYGDGNENIEKYGDVKAAYSNIMDDFSYNYSSAFGAGVDGVEYESVLRKVCEGMERDAYEALKNLLNFDFDANSGEYLDNVIRSYYSELITGSSFNERVRQLLDINSLEVARLVVDAMKGAMIAGGASSAVIAEVAAIADNNGLLESIFNEIQAYSGVDAVDRVMDRIAGLILSSPLGGSFSQYTKDAIVETCGADGSDNFVLVALHEVLGATSDLYDGIADIISANGASVESGVSIYNSVMALKTAEREATILLETVMEAVSAKFDARKEELVKKDLLDAVIFPMNTIKNLTAATYHKFVSVENSYSSDEKLRIYGAMYRVSSELKEKLEEETINLVDTIEEEFAKEFAKFIAGTINEKLLNKAVETILSSVGFNGSTVLTVLKIGINLFDYITGATKKYQAMDICYMSAIFTDIFQDKLGKTYVKYDFGSDADALKNFNIAEESLSLLKYVIISRLIGESNFTDLRLAYANGVFTSDEKYEQYKREIEEDFATTARITLINRDIIFGYNRSILDVPEAPTVTLNFDTLTTNESFSSEYEYCFSNGQWIDCDSSPIPFKLKNIRQVLRVRKRASETESTGNITTVTIPKIPSISGQIKVRYINGEYHVLDLFTEYSYRVKFTNSAIYDFADGSDATVTYTDNIVRNEASEGCRYMHIQILRDDNQNIYYSEPLLVAVEYPIEINVTASEGGRIEGLGQHFESDLVEVTARANDGYVFEGWYVNGAYQHSEAKFTFNATPDDRIEARFERIPVEELELTADIGVLKPGYTFDIIPVIKPANAEKTLRWSSSNENVAIVDSNGHVTCISGGNAVIYAEAHSGVKAHLNITVEDIKLVSIDAVMSKTEYLEREEFDRSTVTLYAHYDNDVKEIVTDYIVTGFDSSTAGEISLTFTFGDKECVRTVTIVHNYVSTVTEPTCTEPGFTTHICTICGDGYSDNFTDPLGHTDSDGDKKCDVCETAIGESDHVPGDINGDGKVNNKDLNRLMRYLAGDSVTVNEAAVDVNGDGKVNNKDLNRLMKYLAGDNVELH